MQAAHQHQPFYSARVLVPVRAPRASGRRQQRDETLESLKSTARSGSVRALAASLGAQFNPGMPAPWLAAEAEGSGEAPARGPPEESAAAEASAVEARPLDLSAATSRPRRAGGARPPSSARGRGGRRRQQAEAHE